MSLAVWKSCSSSQVGCSSFKMSHNLLCSLSHMVAYMERPGTRPNNSLPIARRCSGGIVGGYLMSTGTLLTVGGYISPFTNWLQTHKKNRCYQNWSEVEINDLCCLFKVSLENEMFVQDYLILQLSIFLETKLKLSHEVVSINMTPVNLYVRSISKVKEPE